MERQAKNSSKTRLIRLAAVLIAIVAIPTAIGCGAAHSDSKSASSTSSGTGGSASSGIAQAPAAGVPQRAPAAAASGAATGSASTDAVPTARTNRVVQTGQLSLTVTHGRVQAALDQLSSIAVGAGGFLSDTRSDTGTGTPSGTSTLRVPVANFTSVLAQVRKVGKVVTISTQARDVTADYVDLGARIDALSQTRATYLTLLSRATTIGDTLAVQQQIQPVQSQIEQLQGQQKVLADSSDLATLAVSVTETGAPPPPVVHKSSGFSKALHDAASGFNTGLKAIIRIAGPLLLVLILVSAFGLLGLFGYRRIQRHQAKVSHPGPDQLAG